MCAQHPQGLASALAIVSAKLIKLACCSFVQPGNASLSSASSAAVMSSFTLGMEYSFTAFKIG